MTDSFDRLTTTPESPRQRLAVPVQRGGLAPAPVIRFGESDLARALITHKPDPQVHYC